MAHGLAFRYLPGSSVLHRWDVRCKVAGLVMVTFSLLRMGMEPLVLFSVLLAVCLRVSRLPMKVILSDLKGWGVLLLAILLLKSLSGPEPRLHILPWLSLSRPGMRLGLLTCWQLGLVLSFAVLFTATTRHHDFRNAVAWFLSPLPFVPARRTALMVTLVIRFLPLILDQAEEVRQAVKCRLGERHRNPIRRMKFMALPVIRRSLSRADDLTMALAARGYRDDLPLRFARIPMRDLAALLVLILATLASLNLPAFLSH